MWRVVLVCPVRKPWARLQGIARDSVPVTEAHPYSWAPGETDSDGMPGQLANHQGTRAFPAVIQRLVDVEHGEQGQSSQSGLLACPKIGL